MSKAGRGGGRRKAREAALQALFYMDKSSLPEKEALDLFCRHFNVSEKYTAFFQKLVNGVMERRQSIDEFISAHAAHWKLSRMSGVDRNVMRIAVFEFLHCPDIPPRVSINEAIEIGKLYGTEESGAFINGVLDAICKHLEEKTR